MTLFVLLYQISIYNSDISTAVGMYKSKFIKNIHYSVIKLVIVTCRAF